MSITSSGRNLEHKSVYPHTSEKNRLTHGYGSGSGVRPDFKASATC